MQRRSFAPVLLAVMLLLTRPALAQTYDMPVDVELVLAVDVSGSMDEEEHRVQRLGYIEALLHQEFHWAIRSGGFQRIALTYVEWAGTGRQTIIVPWTVIADEEDADRVAEHLAAAPLSFIRGTSITSVLDFAVRLFDGNGFEGVRRVIDVSGDGPNNMGGPVEPARDRVLEAGVTINGLPIMIRPSLRGGPVTPSLDEYYEDCVIGGPGAFVLPVRELHEMAEAIRRKLVLDIAGLPEPPPGVRLTQARPPVDCGIGERQRGFWSEP